MTLLGALASRTAYGGRAALVVAHPDDETIAAGGSWHLLPDLLLVHVTDGAPRGLDDAAQRGFATPAAYAAARRAELAGALAVARDASVGAGDVMALDMPDQDASLHMRGVSAVLAVLFATQGVSAVLTHAYEGGHPDHDATAFCVAQAAGGREVVEFPAYHAAGDGTLVVGEFLPLPPGEGWGEGRAAPAATAGASAVPLTPAEQARKREMLACFRTQAGFLSRFPTGAESFRAAPAYDFTQPPHPGPLNYERWGWPMSGARWREHARKARSCAN